MTLEKTLQGIKVGDVMTKQLISADPSTTLFQISKMMEQGVGSILVKKDSVPAGIITDRDFAIKVAAKQISLDTEVGKIASFPLKTISSKESIQKASEIMSSQKIRKLAVSENGKIVGMITSTDIVNLISSGKI